MSETHIQKRARELAEGLQRMKVRRCSLCGFNGLYVQPVEARIDALSDDHPNGADLIAGVVFCVRCGNTYFLSRAQASIDETEGKPS